MLKVPVKSECVSYNRTDYGEFVCQHVLVTVHRPCCTGEACGCHGQTTVTCDNRDCTGILDHEADELIRRNL